MTSFLYKWLPIVFGCHCRKDRSFHFRGKQFPLCARCTGELIGFLIALLSCGFFRPHWILLILFMIPMVIDGTVQQRTAYESNNLRRFITGLLFGYGFISLVILSFVLVFHLGQSVGAAYWH